MKITVHVDKCIAAGHCVKAAPQLFAQDEETGLVVRLREFTTAEENAAAEKAARLCPALAIVLEAEDAEIETAP